MVDVGRGPAAPGGPGAGRDVVGESTALIVRALKRRVDQGGFGADDAVDEALLQVLRPGGPRLNDADKSALRTTLQTLARSLVTATAPPQPRALYTFAKDAAVAAWRLHHQGRSPAANIRERADGNARALAKAAIYAELVHATSDEDLVRRAVTRALGEKKRGSPGRPVPLQPGDPLRHLLDLPPTGRLRLPRGDIRGAMAKAAVEVPSLGGLLRQVAVFSRTVMEDALGEELWSLCRPVGFADLRRTRILVATASSVAAQETQLRSRELLYRLKKLDGLSTILGIRVVVDQRPFLNANR